MSEPARGGSRPHLGRRSTFQIIEPRRPSCLRRRCTVSFFLKGDTIEIPHRPCVPRSSPRPSPAAHSAIDITRPGDPITPSSPKPPCRRGRRQPHRQHRAHQSISTSMSSTPASPSPPPARASSPTWTLITANDAAARDPMSYILEGSNDGVTFSPISSGALATPPHPFHHLLHPPSSTPPPTPPTASPSPPCATPVAANSMQLAEVQFTDQVDITSPADQVRMTNRRGRLHRGGPELRQDLRQPPRHQARRAGRVPSGRPSSTSPRSPAPTMLSGFVFFSGNDDTFFPGRTPQNVTILGTNNGVDFTQIFTTPLASATDNYQDQEFRFENSGVFFEYRIVLDIPFSAADMQLGDLQLFGVPAGGPPANDDCTAAIDIVPGTTYSGTHQPLDRRRHLPLRRQRLPRRLVPLHTPRSPDPWTSPRAGALRTPRSLSSARATAPPSPAMTTATSPTPWRASNAVAGTPYLIRVAGANSTTGAFRLSINESPDTSTHTDTPLGLTFNFNGMVHAGEAGPPRRPRRLPIRLRPVPRHRRRPQLPRRRPHRRQHRHRLRHRPQPRRARHRPPRQPQHRRQRHPRLRHHPSTTTTTASLPLGSPAPTRPAPRSRMSPPRGSPTPPTPASASSTTSATAAAPSPGTLGFDDSTTATLFLDAPDWFLRPAPPPSPPSALSCSSSSASSAPPRAWTAPSPARP